MSAALFALLLAAAFLSGAARAQSTPAIVSDCERIADAPVDISDEKAFRKLQKDWLEICQRAIAIDGDNPRVQVALARAFSSTGQDEAAVKLYRAAAAQNSAEGSYNLYERFKSYDRGRVDRPQLVSRAEAEQGLRKAAELGHPYATMMLAILLDRGSTVKRDPAGAIYWAEQALTRPPKDTERAFLLTLLSRLQVKSEKPEERARGIKMLKNLSNSRGDAAAELGTAIRTGDPVRARKLLEQALRSYPGHAIPPLADMLIKGEGGRRTRNGRCRCSPDGRHPMYLRCARHMGGCWPKAGW